MHEIVVVAGTNRPDSNTLKVAQQVVAAGSRGGARVELLDLRELPPALFAPEAYVTKPLEFQRFQDAILGARGAVFVVPEYNGGIPGVLKYFIDMLRFPESLEELPVAFVGLSAGRWGGLRPVEQLTAIVQYRNALVYGRRLLLDRVHERLDADGALAAEVHERLERLIAGFVRFAEAVAPVRAQQAAAAAAE